MKFSLRWGRYINTSVEENMTLLGASSLLHLGLPDLPPKMKAMGQDRCVKESRRHGLCCTHGTSSFVDPEYVERLA